MSTLRLLVITVSGAIFGLYLTWFFLVLVEASVAIVWPISVAVLLLAGGSWSVHRVAGRPASLAWLLANFSAPGNIFFTGVLKLRKEEQGGG